MKKTIIALASVVILAGCAHKGGTGASDTDTTWGSGGAGGTGSMGGGSQSDSPKSGYDSQSTGPSGVGNSNPTNYVPKSSVQPAPDTINRPNSSTPGGSFDSGTTPNGGGTR